MVERNMCNAVMRGAVIPPGSMVIFGPSVFDRDVLAFEMAGVLQALAERAQKVRDRVRGCRVDKPDYRHRCSAARPLPAASAAAPPSRRDELAASSSFDNIIGAGKQCRRHFETEHLGSLEIDEKLNFRGLLDRQISRLFTL